MMEQTILPIAPQVFWGLVTLAGIVAGSFLISWAMPRLPHKGETPPLNRLKSRMGLDHLNAGLFLILLLLWAAIFLMLVGGFLILLWTIIWQATPATPDQVWDWRFSLAKLTALTATLGAVVAFPFTLIRIRLTRRQTETAEEALFNDKINAAATDLAARRQVTRIIGRGKEQSVLTEWEDDLVTRAAAIDRLEGLAWERPVEASRIARQLSTYVRELSRSHPADEPPPTANAVKLVEWNSNRSILRPDLEKAAQTLGRLSSIPMAALKTGDIDLLNANLQGADLRSLNFESSRLSRANLDFAKLSGSNLNNADMSHSSMVCADLQNADLSQGQFSYANMAQARLANCRAVHAKFIGAKMTGVGGLLINATKANFSLATMLDADFQNACFDEARFIRTRFSRARFQSSTFLNARFSQTQISDVNFRESSFLRASFNEISFKQFDCLRTWFHDCIFEEVTFSKNFRFLETEFDGSVFIRSDLSRLDKDVFKTYLMQQTIGDITTKLPPTLGMHPEHWPQDQLVLNELLSARRAWQATLPSE